MKRAIGWAGMKLGFWKLKVTAGTGNAWNRPIQHLVSLCGCQHNKVQIKKPILLY
jgi:hypothetical protein